MHTIAVKSALERLLSDPSRWSREESVPPGFSPLSNGLPSALSSLFRSPPNCDDTNIDDLARDLENVDMASDEEQHEADDNFDASGSIILALNHAPVEAFRLSGEESVDTSGNSAASCKTLPTDAQSNYISSHLHLTESDDIYRYSESLFELVEMIALYDTSYNV